MSADLWRGMLCLYQHPRARCRPSSSCFTVLCLLFLPAFRCIRALWQTVAGIPLIAISAYLCVSRYLAGFVTLFAFPLLPLSPQPMPPYWWGALYSFPPPVAAVALTPGYLFVREVSRFRLKGLPCFG